MSGGLEGSEKKTNIQERQIEESGGHCAPKENAIMDCFVLCCCEKVSLRLEILD